jgi:hypothetical protein
MFKWVTVTTLSVWRLHSVRGGAISLYSSKIVIKKEILRTVSNSGIYCLSDTLLQRCQYGDYTVSQEELFHCTVLKLLLRKRYYVLSLIPEFIV